MVFVPRVLGKDLHSRRKLVVPKRVNLGLANVDQLWRQLVESKHFLGNKADFE